MIGWAEAVGFELLILTILAATLPPGAYKVEGDNTGIVEGWWNNRSRNPEINQVFRCLHSAISNSAYTIHTRYVSTHSNPADAPLRSVYPSHNLLLPPVPIHPDLRDLITDYDSPLHAGENYSSPSRVIEAKLNSGSKRSQALTNDTLDAIGNKLAMLTCLRSN